MKPSLSVVMAMYNEEENVEPVTAEAGSALEAADIPYEIICVSNGSTDRTNERLEALSQKDSRVRPIMLPKKGYGRAVIMGFNAARFPWVTLVSGDGQVDPRDLIKAYEAMEQTGVDVIKPRRIKREDGFHRVILAGIFNILLKMLFLLPGWDVDGPPKIMQKNFLDRLRLESKDFFIDAEIMIKTKYLKGRVAEVPVGWRERKRGNPFIARALMRTSWQYFKNLIWWRIHYRRLVVKALSGEARE